MELSKELEAAKNRSEDIHAAYRLIFDLAKEEDDQYLSNLATRLWNVWEAYRIKYLEMLAAEIDGGNA